MRRREAAAVPPMRVVEGLELHPRDLPWSAAEENAWMTHCEQSWAVVRMHASARATLAQRDLIEAGYGLRDTS